MKEMHNAPHSYPFFPKKGPSSLNCVLIFMYHECEHLEGKGHISSMFYQSVSSVAQFCLTLCNPMDCSTPGLPIHHQLPEFTQTHVHWVGDAIQPSHPLSDPSPPAFNLSQHQGIFSSESVLCIRWPKYWSFSFNISPSDEYSGLISFRMDWLDLLAVQGTLKHLLQHHSSKASILQRSAFFIVSFSFLYSPTLTSIHDYWKNHSFD